MLIIDNHGFDIIKNRFGAERADTLRNAGYRVSKILTPIIQPGFNVHITAHTDCAVEVRGTLPDALYHKVHFLLFYMFPTIVLKSATKMFMDQFLSMSIFQWIWLLLPYMFHPKTQFAFTLPVARKHPQNAFPSREWRYDLDVIARQNTAMYKFRLVQGVLKQQPPYASLYDEEPEVQPPPDVNNFKHKFEWEHAVNRWMAAADDRLRGFPAHNNPVSQNQSQIQSISDALQTLGLSVHHDLKDAAGIKTAWKRMSLKSHPDKGGSCLEQQKVNMAKDFLVQKGILV